MRESIVLGIWTLLLASLVSQDGTANPPTVSPAAFRAWYDAALEGRLAISDETLQRAAGYRYVFIGGFHNERRPGYFDQNARELRSLGVPSSAIHVLNPSSDELLVDNAPTFEARLCRIACSGPEKLVLVGHSRGACDALYFALRHPDFVAKKVEAMFLVQGVFGGTALADYVTGEGPPIEGSMPWRQRLVARMLGRVERSRVDNGRHGGVLDLTTSFATEFWEQTLKDCAAAIPVVGPRTFYVTTCTAPDRLPVLQQATAWYIRFMGPNDGVVAVEDQSLPGVGTVLALLEAGHSDLTNRYPGTRARSRHRKAVVDAVVMALDGKCSSPRPSDQARHVRAQPAGSGGQTTTAARDPHRLAGGAGSRFKSRSID